MTDLFKTRKSLRVFASVGLMAVLTGTVQAGQPAELLALKAKRDEALAALGKPIAAKYQQALVALKASLTKAGDIDAALAVDAELKAVVPDLPAAPAGNNAKKFADLKMTDITGNWGVDFDINPYEFREGILYRRGSPVGSIKITSPSARKVTVVIGEFTDEMVVSPGNDVMFGFNNIRDKAWWRRAK